MNNESKYDSLIQKLTAEIFPMCDWRVIRAQVAQESSFNPNAVSPCGALGLLQVMPSTGWQLMQFDKEDLLEPEKNLRSGITYLAFQYGHLPEIPEHEERLKFALASYNCGRRYVNRALELAYKVESGQTMPAGHNGAMPGLWQEWEFTKEGLKSPACRVGGRTPDWKQTIDYVEKIWARYQGYKRRS